MFIDLERDSAIRVRALMALAAYSVRQTRSETPVCARLIANLAENWVNLSVSAKNNRIEYKVGAEMHRPFFCP